MWRQNTRGDYWVLDRTASTLQKLGGPAPTSSLMYAKFSPQGDRVAYVSKGDIYVERLDDQSITRLTTGADSLHVNGMSDWVYEEEFGLRDGFRWSPDGERIAFWHFDMTGVGTFLMLNNTDSLYPFTVPIQYPLVGTTNSAVTAGVVSARGGDITWIQLAGDARQNYLPWMEWAGPKRAPPAAHEPPAEHRRRAARRRRHRRRAHRLHRDATPPGSTSSTTSPGSRTTSASSGSASATAGATSTSFRGRRARRSW